MLISKHPSERPDDASCLVFERPLSKPRKLTLYLVGHALDDDAAMLLIRREPA